MERSGRSVVEASQGHTGERDDGRSPVVSRRTAIAAAGGVIASGLSGCLGGAGGSPDANGAAGGEATTGGTGGDSGPTGSTATATAKAKATASPDANSLRGHPAATDLAAQPHLGADPFDAAATIIAFEDPSCSRCRAFERNTVPKIRSELIEPGRAAFVFRGYPVVYPWGRPATRALEATFDRDAAAFWALLDHYFAEQSSFDGDNVLERTASFLSANTDLDGSVVVADVEAGAYDDAVQADLDAGETAGIGRTTPIVLLFKEGRYVTKAAGSVSFAVIESALGL